MNFGWQLIFFMQTTFNHITLHYERIGIDDGNSPIVLFLHEALGSIGQWKSFPNTLCQKLNLPGIVYERQGHGTSSPFTEERQADYLHRYALDELPAFLASIDENRPLILVGHSDGGTIALLYASKYPERVQAIVTMAAHVINEPETKAGISPAVAAYKAGKLDGLRKYHRDQTEALFYAWANIWHSNAFDGWDITSEIGQCEKPGLFIQGVEDQYGTQKQLDCIQKEYAGGAHQIMLNNCGHHPHLEQPEQVIEEILNWWSTTV